MTHFSRRSLCGPAMYALFVAGIADGLTVGLSSSGSARAEEVEEVSSPEITVLGQKSRGRSVNDYVPTVSEVSGLELSKRKQTTLGETLSREAGVSSSFFGPNSSRPVIRGLEGERIRVLQNGVGVLDASGTSPDHAVSSDPLLMERIEVVRGSAALLYGTSAIGGVVNVVDGRVPERTFDRFGLLFDSRVSSVDRGRSGGVAAQGSSGRFSFQASGTLRGSEDYGIPQFARSERLRESAPLAPGTPEPTERVANSANLTHDASVGASYVGDSGFLGASFSKFGTEYGTVAEPDVLIDLDRYRVDLSGELKSEGFIQSARLRSAASYYKHLELEGEEIATTFTNRAAEARVDLKHAPIGGFEGVLGVQQIYQRLSALGEEAFLPTTRNQTTAVFFYEELPLGDLTPTLGFRMDRTGVRAEESDRFGSGEAFAFWTPSASVGLLYKLDPEFSLGLNTAFTQRAPNYQEIFANGAHKATGIYEIGDRALAPEIGRAIELSLRHQTRTGQGRVSAFVQDFNRFVALTPTGTTDVDSGLPIFNYRAVDARLFGAEIEYRQRLPWSLEKGTFELRVAFDWVRGLNRTDSSNLPRITPVRETLSLNYRRTDWSADIEVQRSEAQGLVAPGELPTDAFTLLNLGFEIPIQSELGSFSVLGRFNNVLDVEARNHVSFVKDIAPLPGRNFVIGLQARL
jgi:iron complex outermembrane receptor protein